MSLPPYVRGWFLDCEPCGDATYHRRLGVSATFRCKKCSAEVVIPSIEEVQRHLAEGSA